MHFTYCTSLNDKLSTCQLMSTCLTIRIKRATVRTP